MALADWGLRVAGLSTRARPSALQSRRPPAGATSDPVFTTQPGQPMWSEYAGPNLVALRERNIYAARAIEFIAANISGMPFLAGNAKSRVARPTTAMQQLLGPAPGGPNPKWSAAALWKFSIIQYLILGKMAWLKERDASGRVVGLWPLMAQYLVPEMSQVGSPEYFQRYRYGTRGSQGYREFQLSEVVYVWRPSQRDARMPESPLKLARYAIDISLLLDQFDNSFLSNGGVPSHLVITPPFEDTAERRIFRNQFRRKFGGAANANKAMFAETESDPGEVGGGGAAQSIDVKVIGQSQKDSELSNLREVKVQDITVAFGIAVSLLGYSNASKYTNMESDRQNAWQGVMAPLATELEDAVNLTLGVDLDGPQDVGWFDRSGVPELRKKPVFSETEGLAAVAARAITPDEYRADRGMPPLPDGEGDKLITPPKPTVVHAPAALPAPEQGNGAPTAPGVKPKVPPVKVKAVRADRLDAVREQLGLELAAQRSELEMRRDGKRGGRNRARAALSLAEVYDVAHWQARLERNLAPTCRAAGYSNEEITDFSVDITGRVMEGLEADDALDALFVGDHLMTSLDPTPVGERVDPGYIEAALKQLASGELDVKDVLGAIGAQ
jgi:HK97 family phage portal protein